MSNRSAARRVGPVAVAFVLSAVAARAAAPARPLDEGATLRFTVAPAEERTWQLELAAGELLHVEVDQVAADVALTLRDAAGADLWRSDVQPWASGIEEVWDLTDAARRRTIAVQGVGSRPGEVVLEVKARHSASAADRRRFAAEEALRSSYSLDSATDVEASLAAAQRAAGLFAELGVTAKQGVALRRSSQLVSLLGRPGEGLGWLDRAIALAQAANDHDAEAAARIDRSVALFYRGDRAAALEESRRALAAAQAAGSPTRTAKAETNLALFLQHAGDYAEASRHQQDALRRYRELDAGQPAVYAEVNLAGLELQRGDAQRALDLYLAARDRLEAMGDRRALAVVVDDIGAVQGQLGDVEGALVAHRQALTLRRELGDARGITQSLLNVGASVDELGRHAEAAEVLAEAAGEAEAAGDRSLAATARRYRASALLAAGDPAGAREQVAPAVRAHHELGSLPEEAADRLVLARALEAQGDRDAAAAAYRRAAEEAERLDVVRVAAEARYRQARLLADAGEATAAREALDRALTHAESIRSRAPSDRLRTTYFASVRDLYDLALELTLGADAAAAPPAALAAGFALAERARARALQDFLLAAPAAARGGLDADLVRRQDEVRRRLEDLSGELLAAEAGAGGGAVDASPAAADGEVAEIRGRILQAQLEEQSLDRRLQRDEPVRGSFLTAAPADLAQVRAALGDRVLLELHVLPQRSWAFVLTADDLRAVDLPGGDVLAGPVAELRAQLARPGRRTARFVAAARALWNDLLAPVAALLPPGRDLLVSPDGVLHDLPFGALLTAPVAPNTPWARMPFLARERTLSYTPSAAVLRTLRAAGGAAAGDGTVVAFADPPLPADTARGTDARALGAAVRALGGGLSPLPYSREEAAAVAAVFGPRRSRVLVGPDAAESRLSEPAVRHAGVLHFATHGYLDPVLPSQSGLLLAAGGGSDGFLHVGEILRLDLDARLVVLSACRTAAGERRRGEGALSIARAFFFAGARSLVASLWQVSDRSSARLMTTFYRRLEAGAGPARALHDAQLALLADPATASPYYWAAFRLLGDPG